MTNNELLLAMSDMMDAKLKPIYVKLDRMEERMGGLEERMDRLEERVGSLESRVVKLEHHVKRIEVDILENNVVRRLNTIEAYYVETSKRYQASADYMEGVRADVSVLKLVVQDHSKKLQAM